MIRATWSIVASVVLAIGVTPIISGAQQQAVAHTPSASVLLPLTDSALASVVAKQAGNVVLVDFWATWCLPCKAELPHLVALERKLHDHGVRLITVSADEQEQRNDAMRFLDSVAAPLPRYIKHVTSDERFINAIDPAWSGALPALFIYDRTGKRVKSLIGEHPMSDVEAAIRPLLVPSR